MSGRPCQAKIEEHQVTGLKHLERLQGLFERLHGVGCQRDKAGNRRLHFDHYCCLILLYFFNPIVTSLGGLQQASELKKVQRTFGVPRAALGSLSEAVEVFDPQRLQEILVELADQAPRVVSDPRLQDFRQKLVAVDGTLLRALPQVVRAAWQPRSPDGWRLHTQFEVLRGLLLRMDLTDGRNQGPSNEKLVLRQHLAPDCCYVLDRGYEQFSLLNDIVAAQSSYVARIRSDSHFTAQQERPLSEGARATGVLGDHLGRLGSPKSVRIEHPDHPVRLIRVLVPTHPKRNGPPGTSELVLATSLLDVPVDVILLLYRYRWSIELFFRFFKHVLGCRHLLSEDPQGIEIQTYCAIIACLLLSLVTGRKPSLRIFEMMCFFLSGWADEDELLSHIKRLPQHAAQN